MANCHAVGRKRSHIFTVYHIINENRYCAAGITETVRAERCVQKVMCDRLRSRSEIPASLILLDYHKVIPLMVVIHIRDVKINSGTVLDGPCTASLVTGTSEVSMLSSRLYSSSTRCFSDVLFDEESVLF